MNLWKNSTGWVFKYSWFPKDLVPDMDTYNVLGFMYSHCKLRNAKDILELGVGGQGVSTWLFLRVVKETGGMLTSVDINAQCEAYYIDNPQWKFISGDSLKVEVNGIFDVILIDTSHVYEQTVAEMKRYVPKLKTNGLLFMHDTNEPRVLRAIQTYLDSEHNLRFIDSDGIAPRPKIRLYKKL